MAKKAKKTGKKGKPARKPPKKGIAKPSAAKKKPAKKPARKRSGRKAAAKPAAGESSRPAPRLHLHEAGEEAESPRRRARQVAAQGPTHAGVGDEAVRRATGKGWEEWLGILDQAGCREMEHKSIAAMLKEAHQVSDWWSQMITVGYEQARGLREKHETASGYQASMSKTIGAPVPKLYKAWADEKERERWLGETPVEIRVANQDKNIRLTWLKDGPEQGTSVEVGFFAREGGRGMVQVQQNKLADADAVARVKAFWSVKLENLRSVMEK